VIVDIRRLNEFAQNLKAVVDPDPHNVEGAIPKARKAIDFAGAADVFGTVHLGDDTRRPALHTGWQGSSSVDDQEQRHLTLTLIQPREKT
jgi:hypothetical protein